MIPSLARRSSVHRETIFGGKRTGENSGTGSPGPSARRPRQDRAIPNAEGRHPGLHREGRAEAMRPQELHRDRGKDTRTVNHSAEEWVEHTPTASRASASKRSIVGTFHKMSAKHMDRYLEELEWRSTTATTRTSSRHAPAHSTPIGSATGNWLPRLRGLICFSGDSKPHRLSLTRR